MRSSRGSTLPNNPMDVNQRSAPNAKPKPAKKLKAASRSLPVPAKKASTVPKASGPPYNNSAPCAKVARGIEISTLSFIEHSEAFNVREPLARTSPLSRVKAPANVRWPHPERAAQEPQAELRIVSTQAPPASSPTTRPSSKMFIAIHRSAPPLRPPQLTGPRAMESHQ